MFGFLWLSVTVIEKAVGRVELWVTEEAEMLRLLV